MLELRAIAYTAEKVMDGEVEFRFKLYEIPFGDTVGMIVLAHLLRCTLRVDLPEVKPRHRIFNGSELKDRLANWIYDTVIPEYVHEKEEFEKALKAI